MAVRPLKPRTLSDLYRYANRPDENLGRAELGESLCRITEASAKALINVMDYADWEGQHIGWTSGEKTETFFIDLGCGRGLVCASAVAIGVPTNKGRLTVLGWDIDEREIKWGWHYVVPWRRTIECVDSVTGYVTYMEPEEQHKIRVHLSLGNAADFCLDRDVLGRSERLPHQVVRVYAFWKDWPESTKRAIARHLLLEDGELWNVFACSSKREELWQLALTPECPLKDVDSNHGSEYSPDCWCCIRRAQERVLLDEAYVLAAQVRVILAGSGEGHTIYMYTRAPRKV